MSQRQKPMVKILFITLGSVSLALGLIGIIIPGLPTTPFLLLAAALYFSSSKKLYDALMGNRILGGYIRSFRERKAIPLKTKIGSILIMWSMIILSTVFLISGLPVRVTVVFLGIVGTAVMLFIPTYRSDQKEDGGDPPG